MFLGKENPHIFSKFNPLNTYTPLIRTRPMALQCLYINGVRLYSMFYLSIQLFIHSFLHLFFSLAAEEEPREPYEIKVKAKNEPAHWLNQRTAPSLPHTPSSHHTTMSTLDLLIVE